MSWVALSWFIGMAALFAAERLFPEGAAHLPLAGVGVALVLGAIVRRVLLVQAEPDAGRRQAQRSSLVWSLVGASALVLYGTTTDAGVGLLGLDEEAEARWYGVVTSLWVIVWVLSAIPLFVLDRALAANPVMLPAHAARRATEAGLSTALAIALVFPLNYLANAHNEEWDVAYFRTTRAGTSTLALVKNLPEPVHATLFFSPGSDVKEQAVPYFQALSDSAEGRFTFAVVDQAIDPKLAEELKIRENGYVALAQGTNVEKFKVGAELDKAKRELKKLDGTVQKHLLKLAKGQRTAYVLVGHGEASSREKDDPLRKLNIFKKILEAQNYKVKNLGATDGSGDAIPDDAALLLIAAPEVPLMPEEEVAIAAYLERGGSLLVLAEPALDPIANGPTQPLQSLLGQLGLSAGTHPLANAKSYISQRRGKIDRVLLATNKFGSHAAVSTLSKNSQVLDVVLPTVVAIEQVEGVTKGKVSALVRTPPDTWAEVNGNFEADPDESSKVHDVAVAVEGTEGDKKFRAIVVGDVSLFSDPVIQYRQGNAQFALDATRWLVGDEDIAGDVSNEEDVKIQHTRDEDVVWFWGTIALVPALVMLAGLVVVRTRRQS